ncbi:MAG TPA: hypothetical protein VNJ08_15145 [Bacteriovoracaceae bacterium]|nr:hypothetical protein [Bacteriovoracaceae bacterium]
MSKALSLMVPMLALSFVVNAQQDIQTSNFRETVDVLYEPGKLAPDAKKDCSPEEKLAIDCRLTIEKSHEYFKNLKEELRNNILGHKHDMQNEFNAIKTPGLESLLTDYSSQKVHDSVDANLKATKKTRSAMMKKLNLREQPDYNCHLGPDGFYSWSIRRGKCTSGFTNVDPYAVTTTKIEETDDGDLAIIICKKVNYVPFSYQFCGHKSLDSGVSWVDTNAATREVILIKEVQGAKRDGAKNFSFSRGEKVDMFREVRDLVQEEITKKHKMCVPFLTNLNNT